MERFAIILCLVPVAMSLDFFGIPSDPDGNDHHSVPPRQNLKIHEQRGITATDVGNMEHLGTKFARGMEVSGGESREKPDVTSCVNFLKKMVMKALPAFNSCLREMHLSIGRLKKNLREVLPCMVKCVGIKMHILTEEGLLDVDYAKSVLMENVPPQLLEFVWQVWDECIPFVADIDPNDTTCNSYRPVMKCAMNSAFKIAAEVMKQCPDIPESFKNMAGSFTSSKTFRASIAKYVEPA